MIKKQILKQNWFLNIKCIRKSTDINISMKISVWLILSSSSIFSWIHTNFGCVYKLITIDLRSDPNNCTKCICCIYGMFLFFDMILESYCIFFSIYQFFSTFWFILSSSFEWCKVCHPLLLYIKIIELQSCFIIIFYLFQIYYHRKFYYYYYHDVQMQFCQILNSTHRLYFHPIRYQF